LKYFTEEMQARSEQIMHELLRSGRVSVDELSIKLRVSGVSVRRDLRRLEDEGLLRRERGGAVPLGPLLYEALGHDSSFQEQIERRAEEKRRIGLAAAELVRDGDTIALAAGTTTTYIARALHRRENVTVLTNSVNIAMELSGRHGVTVQLSGGVLRGGWFSLAGASALETIQSVFPDICFLSINGIDARRGFTDYHAEEAAVNRALLRQSRRKVVVADYSKFGVVATRAVCAIEEINIVITDTGATDEMIGPLMKKGIEVRRV